MTSIFLFACYSSVAMVFHYVLISAPVCHYVHHYMYLKSSVYNSNCLVLCFVVFVFCCFAVLLFCIIKVYYVFHQVSSFIILILFLIKCEDYILFIKFLLLYSTYSKKWKYSHKNMSTTLGYGGDYTSFVRIQ